MLSCKPKVRHRPETTHDQRYWQPPLAGMARCLKSAKITCSQGARIRFETETTRLDGDFALGDSRHFVTHLKKIKELIV